MLIAMHSISGLSIQKAVTTTAANVVAPTSTSDSSENSASRDAIVQRTKFASVFIVTTALVMHMDLF